MIIQLIRRHRLREEYALVWLFAGVTIVVLSLFGSLVRLLASLVDVTYPPTLIVVAGLLFALVILLSQSVTLSGQADRLRDLAQTIALLERRVRLLEGQPPQVEAPEAGSLPAPDRPHRTPHPRVPGGREPSSGAEFPQGATQ